MTRTVAAAFALLALLAGPAARAQDHGHSAHRPERLGTVHFITSCATEAVKPFDRAVSLLHSFEFGAATAAFEGALTADPACAMAQWGIAVSQWANPFAVGTRSAQQVQLGLSAVERARAIGAKTARERAYVEAVAHLYVDAERRPQKGARRGVSRRDGTTGAAPSR